jgi:hypothetical protein
MKITQQDQRALVVKDFPYLLGIVVFPMSLYLCYVAVAAAVHGGRTRNIIGWGFSALLSFLCGVVFTKRNVFEFDLVQRQLHWRRRGLYSRQQGDVPFDDIRSVTVQSLNTSNSPTYRVLLRTDASEIPLTEAYSTGRETHERICAAINEALKLNPSDAIDNQIQELAMSGRTIDAIRLARTRYGYDLAEAKAFVDGLLQ